MRSFLTIDELKEQYSFLLDMGFILLNENHYSLVFEQLKQSKISLAFDNDLNVLLSVSTRRIIDSDKYDKYSKSYEFFYIYKYLHPEIDFNNINYRITPNLVLKYLPKFEELFSIENEDKTTKELNKIQRAYDKIRWK